MAFKPSFHSKLDKKAYDIKDRLKPLDGLVLMWFDVRINKNQPRDA